MNPATLKLADADLTSPPEYPEIGEYAIIGDCRTAALIDRSGAIEWFCVPSFSSPSIFAAMLDRQRGGAFTLRPKGAHASRRRYLDGTAVLETTFSTATGLVRVRDFMPISGGGHRWATRLQPQRELIRLVECLDGIVDMVTVVEPRPDYGRRAARLVHRLGFGWVFPGPGSVLVIATDFAASPDQNGTRLIGTATLRAGEHRSISLSYTERDVALRPAVGAAARAQLGSTVGWWEAWSARCTFQGARRALVVRSAITLKLLTYALSGAVVAAPTTSLPEAIGAGRNWDYRFCWLRDASITMGAFLGLGFKEEASAFLGWLLHSTRLTRPELRIFYDLHGRNDATEAELYHLEGYRRSRPVRVGNAAGSQLQLDTYGSVILAAYDYIGRMGMLDGGELQLLSDFGKVVCKRWREPDQGMWEVRGPARHFTATKMMCWAALDRLVRLGEQGLGHIPLELFRQNRDAIAAVIEAQGFSERLGSYVAELDGGDAGVADASLLLMGWVGYGDPTRQRLRSTMVRLTEALGRDGLYSRYPHGFDGEVSREGTFGICSAWAADLLARQGDLAGANQVLDRLAGTANDVGLFAEEFDPDEAIALGNFPQAFTHAGLITAALAIEAATDLDHGQSAGAQSPASRPSDGRSPDGQSPDGQSPDGQSPDGQSP